jgi:hypothetical protein
VSDSPVRRFAFALGPLVAVLVVAAFGCASSPDPGYDRYGGSGDYDRHPDPYADRYPDSSGQRHPVYYDPGAARLERHQRREQRDLERDQERERQELLRDQRDERRVLRSEGEWDAEDKRRQKRDRREQNREFRDEDRELDRHQDREWLRHRGCSWGCR